MDLKHGLHFNAAFLFYRLVYNKYSLFICISVIYLMELGKKVALARKQKGLTQEELADMANITVRTVQRIESGQTIPRAFTLKSLEQALGTDFNSFTDQPPNQYPLTGSVTNNDQVEQANEKHFLQMLCLSCFAFLVIPFVHFLVPSYILKKYNNASSSTIALARKIIKRQIYWTIALSLVLLLTLGYNFLVALYFNDTYFVHYLWPFSGMYLINAVMIVNDLRIASNVGRLTGK